MKAKDTKNVKRRRLILASLVVAAAAVIAPLGGYVYVAVAQPSEQQAGTVELASDAWSENNPRSEYWREARKGVSGTTTVQGLQTGVLINAGGENFRQFRNGPVSTYGPWLLGISLLAIAIVFSLTGGQKLASSPSGKRVPRWSVIDRTMHWTMATLFIVLTITGLSLLFGRAVLIPLMGPEGFSAWASLAKIIHNWSGPIFLIALISVVVTWIPRNIPDKRDFEWFRKGGGMLGKHVPAGRMNGGEKAWFWFIATAGIAVGVTGVLMILPTFFADRSLMQILLVVHAGLALVWIAISFGHIYLGTIGVEGALEGMTRGHVSAEWAEQHHDLWYEDVKSEEFVPQDQDGSKGGVASQPGSPA
ncbi:MAG: formate dehydrogenase subunit gamma [Wenzhouxiangellaceae bacterium]|nr:formate dehydrogenase subunit gamma [Wenzhouxiangellaceae bacterium]